MGSAHEIGVCDQGLQVLLRGLGGEHVQSCSGYTARLTDGRGVRRGEGMSWGQEGGMKSVKRERVDEDVEERWEVTCSAEYR
jgi:hypothetical protein